MSSFPIPEGFDLDALIRESTPGAEAGDTRAISDLATAYLLKQDWEAAEPWAQRLLDGRLSVVGMGYLAEIQERRGDQAGAQEWKRRAEEARSRVPAGFPMERLLGPIVERFGDEPDLQTVRAAAEAGDVMAMTLLGTMLLSADDPTEAVRWLTPGAEAGDRLAITALYCALTEQGDDDGAAHWRQAAVESDILGDVFEDVAAPTGDRDKARDRRDRTPQARAEENETGPDA
ncbi:MAG TPA: hypothetical protein VGM10_22720 [Actinocrinis sp.]|jgi:hypothetical protein